MCNRLGKRKFLERYKESRAVLQERMRHEKDRYGRPLYNNYLPNVMAAMSFDEDRLYCPWNKVAKGHRRLVRLHRADRLQQMWLACYSGVVRLPNRRQFYATVLAEHAQQKADADLMYTAERMQRSVEAAA